MNYFLDESINKQKNIGGGPWHLNTNIIVMTLKTTKQVTENGKRENRKRK